MRVLFADQIYYKGHRYFDSKTIQNLATICDLTVLSPNNWYEQIDDVTYLYGANSIYKKKMTYLTSLFTAMRNCILTYKKTKELHPDILIWGEYEIVVFYIFRILFRNIKIILIHHNNLDQLDNEIKKYMFNSFKDKVYHCVLEPYIKDWLISTLNIYEKKVFCWPHPIERKHKFKKLNPEFDCVALSNSNDETIIQKIIDFEISEKIFFKQRQRVVLRSKLVEFDDGALTVIRGWIDEADYNYYISHAKSVMITVPQNFRNRVSASIIEAFDKEIPVIGNSNPLFNYYRTEYSSICYLLDLQNIDRILADINANKAIHDFELFKERHCDAKIRMFMERDLRRICA